jgi:hypothetical protein
MCPHKNSVMFGESDFKYLEILLGMALGCPCGHPSVGTRLAG